MPDEPGHKWKLSR